jgi:hypothetical protein
VFDDNKRIELLRTQRNGYCQIQILVSHTLSSFALSVLFRIDYKFHGEVWKIRKGKKTSG